MRPVAIIRAIALGAMSLAILSCARNEPIRIGFVGGLSGKAADLGIAGRNGVQLALEQQNAKGGLHGHPLELIVKDDEQNPATATRVVAELLAQHLDLIIGPMTSSMAMAMVPKVNASGSILLSPIVTTTDLSGKDDQFLRVISSTAVYSAKSAHYQFEKFGVRTVAVIYDSNNRSYTESWLKGFQTTFESLGGRVVLAKSFPSSKDTVVRPMARELLAAKADAVLIITNAVDAASLCQQLRSLKPGVRIIMAEWASTERFLELAGPAAEGVVVTQFVNRSDPSPRYQDFVKAYQTRFSQAPGFAGMASYDAALVAIEALGLRKGKQNLKDAIVEHQTFQGVQQVIKIDRYGDADRSVYLTVVKDGRYVTLDR